MIEDFLEAEASDSTLPDDVPFLLQPPAWETESHPADLRHEVTQLHEQNAAGLFRYAAIVAKNQCLAQEALQESFMRYFMVRSEGQPIENGKAWLLRVLHNSGPVGPKRFRKPKIKY